MVVGRFAPSPSGILHLGNLTTALLSWLDIRLRDGRFIIRIDDLDSTRSKPEFAHSNIKDLERLGIDWDEIDYQSQHNDEYEHYFDLLLKMGNGYACRCSRSDSLSFDADGNYLSVCKAKNLPMKEHAVRLAAPNKVIGFEDRFLGSYEQNIAMDVGDFIVKRKDGIFAYHLACAIDEHRHGISDILRGADLLESTPRQLYIMELLEFEQPTYGHVPLVTDLNGEKLSKRSRVVTESLFNAVEPERLVGGIAGRLNLSDGSPISATTLLESIDYATFESVLSNISNNKLT